jgi:hypothetical protein
MMTAASAPATTIVFVLPTRKDRSRKAAARADATGMKDFNCAAMRDIDSRIQPEDAEGSQSSQSPINIEF